MSPANRRNPDHTDALGRFGWDVLPGFYRVTAGKHGCRAPTGHAKRSRTPVFAIPPAVTSAAIHLRCPLHRRRSRVGLRVLRTGKTKRGTAYLLRARVHGHARRVGTITFTDRRRVLARVAVVAGDGVAAAPVLLRGTDHRFRASYLGNAFLGASRSHTVTR